MGNRSLLLVDDDESSSQILKFILEDEGYEVDLAVTGEIALNKTSSRRYDLVLLDYILPDMKGQEVAAKIKKVPPSPKIILLTGYAESEGEPKDNNYDRVLLKPVPPETIVSVIAGILS
jgi:two-component system nitrogen regulation response regulator NtrX